MLNPRLEMRDCIWLVFFRIIIIFVTYCIKLFIITNI